MPDKLIRRSTLLRFTLQHRKRGSLGFTGMLTSHLFCLWSFDQQEKKLRTEEGQARQLREARQQGVIFIDL